MFRTTLTTLLLFMTAITVAQSFIETTIKSEQRAFRKDTLIQINDFLGNNTRLPISILKGKQDGPVFTIVSGIHGFEYPPIMATQAILNEINLDSLRGCLIVVPIANLGSFYTRTPFINPLDKTNLNNAFPGKKDGTVTQKIAYFISNQIIPLSDVFLDIHGGDASEDLLPFVCYYNNKAFPEQTKLAKQLSEASGFEYVVSYPFTLKDYEPAKYTFKQACQVGKVALSIESGKLGNVHKKEVLLAKHGVYRMLKVMNMYHKPLEKVTVELVQLNRQRYIDADSQGIFYSTLKAGDQVQKGDEVGYITNEFGKLVSRFTAPVSGTVLYKISTPPVNKDDTLMCISYFE